MGVLSHLNPNRVFYYFEEISNIHVVPIIQRQ